MRLFSPAKVNFVLKIGGLLPNGYHEIGTWMVPLKFGDDLDVGIKPSARFSCAIEGPDLGIPVERNLIYRAAELFSEVSKIPFRLQVQLKKKIPTGAGLGGGSSNAGVLLQFLHSYFRPRILLENLAVKSKIIGADVPFFVLGRPAWCEGVGEKMRPCPLPHKFSVVLIFSSKGVPTGWAYSQVDESRKVLGSRKNFPTSAPKWISSSFTIPKLENDFEAPIFSIRKDLERAKLALAEEGALAASLSGSGATVFGLFREESLAKRAVFRLRKRGYQAIHTET